MADAGVELAATVSGGGGHSVIGGDGNAEFNYQGATGEQEYYDDDDEPPEL